MTTIIKHKVNGLFKKDNFNPKIYIHKFPSGKAFIKFSIFPVISIEFLKKT